MRMKSWSAGRSQPFSDEFNSIVGQQERNYFQIIIRFSKKEILVEHSIKYIYVMLEQSEDSALDILIFCLYLILFLSSAHPFIDVIAPAIFPAADARRVGDSRQRDLLPQRQAAVSAGGQGRLGRVCAQVSYSASLLLFDHGAILYHD